MEYAALQRREAKRPVDAPATAGRAGPQHERLTTLNRMLNTGPTVQRLATMTQQPNRSGLPDGLKSGIEALSGISLDGVRVHRNSSRPATMQAQALAQGSDIHIGPGQERHLPHEAWHVVQQAQGRVPATAQMAGGVAINDDAHLEREADIMGARALAHAAPAGFVEPAPRPLAGPTIQRRAGIEFETSIEARAKQDNGDYDNNKGWVPQDVTMQAGAGWQVDSDNSKLEFVTHPPVELAQLGAVVDNMIARIGRLPLTLASRSDLGPLLGFGASNYVVLPYNKRAITGAPQGTIGIPFNRLFAFFDLLTRYQMKMSLTQIRQNKKALEKRRDATDALKPKTEEQTDEKNKRLKKHADDQSGLDKDANDHHAISGGDAAKFTRVTAAVNAAAAGNRAAAQLAPDELAKLKGLLHFIGQYVIFASFEGDKSYEKSRFPVMARSSFRSMYEALDKPTRDVFLAVANAVVVGLGFEPTTELLPGRKDATVTVTDWLASIKKPTERLKNEKGKPFYADLLTAPGIGTHPTDKSMGSLGLDKGLVVVELRQLRLNSTGNSFSTAALRNLVRDLKNLVAPS